MFFKITCSVLCVLNKTGDIVYNPSMKKEQLKSRFISQIGDWNIVTTLFDAIHEIAFFMLDREGRIVMFNRRSCELFNFRNEAEALGKTNYDLFPKHLADHYTAGDRQIMESKKPVLNELEVSPVESNRLTIHSKFPVYGKNGQVIGVAGVYKFIDNVSDNPNWFGHFTKVINYIHTHYASKLSIDELAKISHLSQSQLTRRFRKLFGSAPHEYIMRVRVDAARTLLEVSHRTISDIAMEVGFTDHSHFIRSFKQLRGITPTQYRRRHHEHT